MNSQDIVKRHLRTDGLVDVFKIFGPVFQGEGPFAGVPCFFVRLAECNLQCPGCDTVYSESHPSRPKKRGLMCPMEIAKELTERMDMEAMFPPRVTGRRLVVVSGGEPFRQDIRDLLWGLIDAGFFVQIESNGTLPVLEGAFRYNQNVAERNGVYIVCSPKTPKVHESYNRFACAFKYVGAHDDLDPTDGLPIHVLHNTSKSRVARPGPAYTGPIYLQPMDHQELGTVDWTVDNHKSTQAVLQSCYRFGYTFGLQLHKLVGVE